MVCVDRNVVPPTARDRSGKAPTRAVWVGVAGTGLGQQTDPRGPQSVP
jgi:hypothetical protein